MALDTKISLLIRALFLLAEMRKISRELEMPICADTPSLPLQREVPNGRDARGSNLKPTVNLSTLVAWKREGAAPSAALATARRIPSGIGISDVRPGTGLFERDASHQH